MIEDKNTFLIHSHKLNLHCLHNILGRVISAVFSKKLIQRSLVWRFPSVGGPFTERIKSLYIYIGVPVMAQWLTNPTKNHKVAGLIPDLAQWVKDPVLP